MELRLIDSELFDECPDLIKEVLKAHGFEVTHAMKLDKDWYVMHSENKEGTCSTCIGAVIDEKATFVAPEKNAAELDFILSAFSAIVHDLLAR